MGYMCHHVIIVTSWDKERLIEAYEKAISIFPVVSPFLRSSQNGYHTFFVPPDGSKEGWADSDTGNRRRWQFTDWLGEQRHEDGSSWLDWCEVQYGDEEGDDRLLQSNEVRLSTQQTTLYGMPMVIDDTLPSGSAIVGTWEERDDV